MRVNPISQQNNQSFRAVNMKYYKQAVSEVTRVKFITDNLINCLRYDIYAKKIPVQDGIDTLIAMRNLLDKPDITIERDLKIYHNLLNEEHSNQ